MEQLYVIKIGGNVIDSESSLQAFLQNFASIRAHKILVHGGGKIASRIGDQLGITSKYINGRRITDEQTIDLVTMVYGGLVNKKIVASLQSMSCNAIGLTGADANVLPAVKRPVRDIDYGYAGDLNTSELRASNWRMFLENNLVPVVASLTHDGMGHMLNTNADTIASAIAVCLSEWYEVRLVYCFEKKGILLDVADEHSVVRLFTKATYANLLKENRLFEGILPKIDNAFAAIDAGVSDVLIGDARDLLMNLGNNTEGTLIKP